jgi:hypothetical protein
MPIEFAIVNIARAQTLERDGGGGLVQGCGLLSMD